MERLLEHVHRLNMDHWSAQLAAIVHEKRKFLDHARGNFLKFKNVLERMPGTKASAFDLDRRVVTIGEPSDLAPEDRQLLMENLLDLCPWRKGPFNLFGIALDSEWQSWMKWERVKPHIKPLSGRRILDIGSSNGYYMFRMAACDPLMVLGLEPQSTFYFQYLALQKFLNLENVFCLPIPHDQLPRMDHCFDTVFCMGVLYHRKSPVEMLKDMYDSMRPGGQLILENLVMDSRQNYCLFPRDRYAKMRNVFFIPDLLAMESWLLRSGFVDVQCVDITRTSVEEQRKTRWIQTESLTDFLDPADPDKTVEGYPAPVRAIFTATAA